MATSLSDFSRVRKLEKINHCEFISPFLGCTLYLSIDVHFYSCPQSILQTTVNVILTCKLGQVILLPKH